MICVRGTPTDWKKFLFDVSGRVKQLGYLIFFMTLLSADLQWNELISVISKLINLNSREGGIDTILYNDSCKMLNSSTVAKYFQNPYPICRSLFRDIILDWHLGKYKIYVVRVEFQVCGSPHVHGFYEYLMYQF